jgi:hypothetical protein
LPDQSWRARRATSAAGIHGRRPLGLRREPVDLAQRLELGAQEVEEQPADVVAALAQRRDGDEVARQPVQTAAARNACACEAFSRSTSVAAIRRTSTLRAALGAQRLDLGGLEHAQQHGLHLGGRVADLVEEQGAAGRWAK